LEWIPDPDAAEDVPGDGVYSLITDILATLATDACVGNLQYPPGTGSSDTTLQTWLLSLQSSYSDNAPCTAPADADGCPFSQFSSDPQAYRQLAVENNGTSVSFDLVNGHYIGIVDVPSTYQATFGFSATGASIVTGYVSNHSGLIIRTIAKSCAGVSVEAP
jgi:hypothetical protein